MSRPTTTAPRTRDRDTRWLPWFCGKPPRSPVGCPDRVTVASGLRPKCPVLLAQP
jgi:hypothetical protein